jgi:glucosyltransferase
MSNIKVSIVCTNYNKGHWIREAIESFLAQKCKFEYEIILIDDGSTDISPEIIKEYAARHPGIIRAFYNKKNIGITKTWIKACKEFRGKYIARCDGDDYWIDSKKLEKQVALLEKTKDSQWCSTDYNIITPEGKLTHTSAFESGLIDRAESYAEMLATKGFTMSSTWLVDANLMQEINAEIDSSAVDDTFNIQLELFNKTKLTYLPEATVVYRLNEGSDSRPVEIDKIRSRHKRLLNTQLEYIEKYKDVAYSEILKILLPQNMQNEMWATERLQIIHEQRRHIKQQEAHVKELEEVIHAIIDSRSYRLATACTRLARFVLTTPARVINKLFNHT